MIRKLSIAGAALVLILTVYIGALAQQSSQGENRFAPRTNQEPGSVSMFQGYGPGWARRGYGRNGGGWAAGAGACQLDLGARQTLTGTVTAINMGIGQGFPNFTLDVDGKPVTIVTSPFRALLNTGFEVSVGDRMSVEAFPSSRREGTYVAAELNNERTKKSLTLRDAQGFPNRETGAGRCRCSDCQVQ